MTKNITKRPLFKAIIFGLVSTIFMIIAGTIIDLMKLEPGNIYFLLIHTFWVCISIIVGIMVIRKLERKFVEIGIRRIEKNTLKNAFYLIPFFIIVMLPVFAGFDKNIDTCKIILFWVIHYIVVGIHEEFYFRGIILSLFKDNLKKAIIIPSIIFGMVHISNLTNFYFTGFTYSDILGLVEQIVFAFIIGVVYAEVVLITKSILPVIFFHAMYDLTVTISNNYFIIGSIQWLLLIIYAIVMWLKLFKESPNCT